jgi:hypothetical protein
VSNSASKQERISSGLARMPALESGQETSLPQNDIKHLSCGSRED